MRLKHSKTLITGKPGVGKTTLVQKIIKRMGSVNMAGFYTSEIRSEGSRLGFELQGLKGNNFIREIKQRLDIRLLEVTHANRDRLPEAIVEWL
jgi:nucleoside-triphosphatase